MCNITPVLHWTTLRATCLAIWLDLCTTSCKKRWVVQHSYETFEEFVAAFRQMLPKSRNDLDKKTESQSRVSRYES